MISQVLHPGRLDAGVRKTLAAQVPGLNFASALPSQQVAHRDRDIAEVDVDPGHGFRHLWQTVQ